MLCGIFGMIETEWMWCDIFGIYHRKWVILIRNVSCINEDLIMLIVVRLLISNRVSYISCFSLGIFLQSTIFLDCLN